MHDEMSTANSSSGGLQNFPDGPFVLAFDSYNVKLFIGTLHVWYGGDDELT